jgi:putative DNA primase/helicase
MKNTSQRSKFVATPSQAATPKSVKPTYSIVMHKGFGLHVSGSDGSSLKACPDFSIKGCVVDANGQNPAYLMCFETLLGGEVTEAIPLAVLASPEQLVKLLLNRGFPVPQSNIKQRGLAIKHYLEQNCPQDQQFVRANSDGWMTLPDGTKVYVYGDSVLGATSSGYQAIRLPASVASHRQGNRDAWYDLLKLLKREPIAVLAVCAALSAPLLGPLGFATLMLFLVGPSSIGKTVILTLVASIFDSPNDMLTWEGTDNGIEANALKRKDKPLTIDEVGQAKARLFAALSYRLTNTGSKQRATAQGEAVAVQRTCTTVISAGEVAPLDLMAQAGMPAKQGQIARLVSVVAQLQHGVWNDLGKFASGAEKSHHVLRELQIVHGIAGKQFCKHLAKDVDVYVPTFHAVADDLAQEIYPETQPQADGVPGRVLRNFALFAFAGLLAVEKKTVPWSDKNVMDAVKRGYASWLADYQARQPIQDSTLLAPLRLFFQSQRSSKFKPLSAWRDNHEGTVAGFEYANRKGELLFLVYPTYFKQNLCGDHALKDVLTALRKANLLREGPRNVPTLQVLLPGTKQNASFYAIRPEILHD